jgi:hypothetical protein
VIRVDTELLVQRVVPIGKVLLYLLTLQEPECSEGGFLFFHLPELGSRLFRKLLLIRTN